MARLRRRRSQPRKYDPDGGTAFAVYSETDHSLDFYKRKAVPEVGSTFEGKVVTEVYTGFETAKYTGKWPSDDCPWYGHCADVKSVTVVDDGIQPEYMAWWFCCFYKTKTLDLGKLDTSRCRSMERLFSSVHAKEILGLDGWDTSSVESMVAMFDGTSASGGGLYDQLKSYSFCWNWNVGKCRNFTAMFFNCLNVDTLDLSNWDCSSYDPQNRSEEGMWGMQGIYGGTEGYQGSYKVVKVNASSSRLNVFFDTKTALYEPPSDADGKWYAKSDGMGYAPDKIPSGKADTYYASKSLYEQAVGKK